MGTDTKAFHEIDPVRKRLRYAGVTHDIVAQRQFRSGIDFTSSRPILTKKVFATKNNIPSVLAPAVKSFIFQLPKLPKNTEFTALESYLAQKLYIPEDNTSRPHVHHKHRKQRSKPKMSYVFATMAVLVFILGIGVSVQGLLTNKKVEAQVKNASASDNLIEPPPQETDLPASSRIAYRVAPNLPRLIRIPKIKVESRIVRLGMQTSGKLRSPSNIYDTGWFEGSSKPNESGAMLLAGHVHGPTKPGIFYNLHKLVAGDTFEVERGDGQVFNYRVVDTKTYHRDSVDMSAAMTSYLSGERGLNIITCSGDLDDSGNHYEDRLIVFAVQQ